ncbi:MAG: thioredoxin [Planctomycetia bacterium]|nr:thioredoxin [Planctomycetia bacterium]
MSASPWIREVTEATFEQEVLEKSREKPVIVDFWAAWCGPCRALAPLLEKLVDERKGEVLLAKVDVEENQQLAQDFRIESIPAVKAIRNGQVVLEFLGMLPEAHLRKFLDQVCPSEADKLADAAAKLEAGKPAEAEQLYRQALELDRNHETSQVGLARVLIDQGQKSEATEVLDRVIPHGALATEVDRLRGLLSLGASTRDLGYEKLLRRKVEEEPNNPEVCYEFGCLLAAQAKYAESLEYLLRAAANDKELARTKVKETMVKIFQVIGARSDLADEYRDKLQKLLY